MAATIDRINELSEERSRLFRLAGNGQRGDAEVLRRIQAISQELEQLWDRRRQERAGRRDGIDLLVDRAYQEAYGRVYEDAVAPPRVGEPDPERLTVAA